MHIPMLVIGAVFAVPTLYVVVQSRRAGVGFESTSDAVGTWFMVALGVICMIAGLLG